MICDSSAWSWIEHILTAALLQGFELVFYGDSITETWRGTDMGRPCSRCAGVPDIFHKYFGAKYDTEVLAVGGTQLSRLPCLWHSPRAH